MTNRQLYDAFDELVKEDTLSYNTAGELFHKCSYDYRNNTSLYCDQYTYHQGKLKKWKTFYHWHTISLSGKVIEKKGKRRHYNYIYARDSLCAVKGYYYSTKLRRKIRRKKGIKQSDIQIKKKRIKLPNSSAYKKNVEILEKKYTNGLLTHVEKRVDVGNIGFVRLYVAKRKPFYK